MKKSLFIGEIGINHQGNMDKAFRMIDKAKACGADFAKFQFYDPVRTLGREHQELAYAQSCFFSKAQHETLRRYCEQAGIEYLVSVFDIKEVKWAAGLCKAMKIASRMNKRQDFISAVAATKLPVYMSVQPEVNLRRDLSKRFNLMWCVREYPTAAEEIMKYPYNGFGLSSHCPDWKASLWAWSNGARVFENHLCESKDEKGCDIPASINFEDYAKFISATLAA